MCGEIQRREHQAAMQFKLLCLLLLVCRRAGAAKKEYSAILYKLKLESSLNQDISSWDVSNVTTMSHLFNGQKSFNEPLENWDVSKVTDTEASRCIFLGHGPSKYNLRHLGAYWVPWELPVGALGHSKMAKKLGRGCLQNF